MLIGQDRDSLIEVEACIEGMNAEEAGAHVTFTQDTWEHIYKVKDREYPRHRIVGWYHSHPGFGVFLSEHDTFIHKNFFSSPGQVAWVFDPQSDEEGCFGWVNGRIERLSRLAVVDRRGGEGAGENGKSESASLITNEPDASDGAPQRVVSIRSSDDSSLQRLVTNVFSHLTVLLLGLALAWYVFPRVVLVPVPIDPQTGQPISDSAPESKTGAFDRREAERRAGDNARDNRSPDDPSKAAGTGAKGDNVKPQ